MKRQTLHPRPIPATERKVLLPRLMAVAEKAWAGRSGLENFYSRIGYHLLDVLGEISDDQRGRADESYISEQLNRILSDIAGNSIESRYIQEILAGIK